MGAAAVRTAWDVAKGELAIVEPNTDSQRAERIHFELPGNTGVAAWEVLLDDKDEKHLSSGDNKLQGCIDARAGSLIRIVPNTLTMETMALLDGTIYGLGLSGSARVIQPLS